MVKFGNLVKKISAAAMIFMAATVLNAGSAMADNSKPATVSDVHWLNESVDGVRDYSDCYLEFTPVSGAYGYEYMGSDGVFDYYSGAVKGPTDPVTGKATYTPLGQKISKSSENLDHINTYCSLSSMCAWDSSKNTWFETSDGGRIYGFTKNGTYSFRVRAYNAEIDENGNLTGNYIYGDWSKPISAKFEVVDDHDPQEITGLKFVKYDAKERVYYFTCDNVNNKVIPKKLDAVLSYDAEGKEKITATIYMDYSPEDKLYSFSSYMSEREDMFQEIGPVGTPIFISACDYINGVKTPFCAPVSFAIGDYTDQATTAAIPNLVIKKVDDDYIYFSFPAVLNADDVYYICMYDDPEEKHLLYKFWFDKSIKECKIPLDSVEADKTYYFRAQAYHRFTTYYWSKPGQSYDEFKAELDARFDLNYYSISSNEYLNLYFYSVHKEEKTVWGTNVVPFKKAADEPAKVTPISDFKLIRTFDDPVKGDYSSNNAYFEFGFKGELKPYEIIQLQYSTSKNFDSTKNIDGTYKTDHTTGSLSVCLPMRDLIPGTKYYVRARVITNGRGSAVDTMESYYFGPWTKSVSVTCPSACVNVYPFNVSGKSVTLYAYSNNGVSYSGFRFQKKVDGKWKTIYEGNEWAYTDNEVKAESEYSYRACAYYYNRNTKKTVYGEYAYVDVCTWGDPLNVVVQAASKSSIKVSWDKVNGAEGYEILRPYSGRSNDYGRNDHTKLKAVAAVGASANSYTVKGLTNGSTYSFTVRAFKTIGGKRCYIDGSGSTYLGFTTMQIISTKTATNGKVTVKWKKIPDIAGYEIEKFDSDKDEWVKYTKKKISKSATSVTFDKAVGNETVYYRIRAYKKNKIYTSPIGVTVAPVMLPTPTKVKVSAVGDGMYKFTWKKVKGADYYRIYRTDCDDAYTYYPVWKGYAYSGYSEGYYLREHYTYNSKTKSYEFVNSPRIETTTAYIEPLSDGNVHYYYVVACKRIPAKEFYINDEQSTVISYGTECIGINTGYCDSFEIPNVTVSSSKAKKVKLKWNKTKEATGYEVLRATSANGKYTVIKTIKSANTVSYTDKKAQKGKTYYYKVRALGVNKIGKSCASDSNVTVVKTK